jgi:dephospho-CoA kinase
MKTNCRLTKYIGLAGYMGAGKSTCANYIKSHNAFIIDADNEAKKLMLSSDTIKKSLVETFGPTIGSDTSINFSVLGKIVFNSIENLKKLNSIVHPSLLAEFSKQLQELTQTETPFDYIVLDAALLPMWDLPIHFDVLIWIESSYQYRFQRLNAKLFDKLSAEEIEKRMRFQQQLFESPKNPPWITISNNSNIDELKMALSAIL